MRLELAANKPYVFPLLSTARIHIPSPVEVTSVPDDILNDVVLEPKATFDSTACKSLFSSTTLFRTLLTNSSFLCKIKLDKIISDKNSKKQ